MSSLETARIAVDASLEGKTLSRYVSLILSESEVDARSIAEAFERVQPPGGRRGRPAEDQSHHAPDGVHLGADRSAYRCLPR